ncbi:MAG TPA: DUF192 domain-containing protein [Thermoleophilaceae bacterium]
MSRIGDYPFLELETGIRMHLAHTWRARLAGLALMPGLDPDEALVIPHCTSVHTFGMRFPIDVVFVDRQWEPIYIEYDVGPRRVLRSRFARSVIEVAAGEAGRLADGLRLQRALEDGRSARTAPAPPSR